MNTPYNYAIKRSYWPCAITQSATMQAYEMLPLAHSVEGDAQPVDLAVDGVPMNFPEPTSKVAHSTFRRVPRCVYTGLFTGSAMPLNLPNDAGQIAKLHVFAEFAPRAEDVAWPDMSVGPLDLAARTDRTLAIDLFAVHAAHVGTVGPLAFIGTADSRGVGMPGSRLSIDWSIDALLDTIADHIGVAAGLALTASLGRSFLAGNSGDGQLAWRRAMPLGHGLLVLRASSAEYVLRYAPSGFISALYKEVGYHRPPGNIVVVDALVAEGVIVVSEPRRITSNAGASADWINALFTPEAEWPYAPGSILPRAHGSGFRAQYNGSRFYTTGCYAMMHRFVWGLLYTTEPDHTYTDPVTQALVTLPEHDRLTAILFKFTTHELASEILVRSSSGEPELQQLATDLLAMDDFMLDAVFGDIAKPNMYEWPEAIASGLTAGDIAQLKFGDGKRVPAETGIDVIDRITRGKAKRLFVASPAASKAFTRDVDIDADGSVWLTKRADNGARVPLARYSGTEMAVDTTYVVRNVLVVGERSDAIKVAETALNVTMLDGEQHGNPAYDWYSHVGLASAQQLRLFDALTLNPVRKLAILAMYYAWPIGFRATGETEKLFIGNYVDDAADAFVVPDGGDAPAGG